MDGQDAIERRAQEAMGPFLERQQRARDHGRRRERRWRRLRRATWALMALGWLVLLVHRLGRGEPAQAQHALMALSAVAFAVAAWRAG